MSEPMEFSEEEIPAIVMEAARAVTCHMSNRGCTSWELMGLCSRDHAFRLRDALAELDAIRFKPEKVPDEPRCGCQKTDSDYPLNPEGCLTGIDAVRESMKDSRWKELNDAISELKRRSEMFDRWSDGQSRGLKNLADALQKMQDTLGPALEAMDAKILEHEARISGTLEEVNAVAVNARFKYEELEKRVCGLESVYKAPRVCPVCQSHY